MRYFGLEAANIWGDYGNILQGGFAKRRKADECLLLERTGPFVPPMFFPSVSAGMGADCVAVTDALRKGLIDAGHNFLEFRRCEKSRIIASTWENWDRHADEPRVYPDEGEPENYILNQPHSPVAALATPDMWEIIPPILGCDWTMEDSRIRWQYDYFIDTNGTMPTGFFRTVDGRRVIVCERTKSQIERMTNEWVVYFEYHPKKISR